MGSLHNYTTDDTSVKEAGLYEKVKEQKSFFKVFIECFMDENIENKRKIKMTYKVIECIKKTITKT